jgi:prepilin-type N-terminal cleavage/methylation domain-containing protein
LSRRRGFTLLEMVIVIAILVAIAGLALFSVSSAEDDAKLQLARSELATLRDACLRWRSDLGRYPDVRDLGLSVPTTPAATISPLIALVLTSSQTLTDGSNRPLSLTRLPSWNPVTRRGGRGPYLSLSEVRSVDDATFEQPGFRPSAPIPAGIASRIIIVRLDPVTGDPSSTGTFTFVIAEPRDVAPPSGAAADLTDGARRSYYWYRAADPVASNTAPDGTILAFTIETKGAASASSPLTVTYP